jgi:hypothetical protein
MAAILLTLVWMSRILNLRWPERELQIATGFGFYFIVVMIVNFINSQQLSYPLYRCLDQISVASYLGTLAYWMITFSQNIKKRKYFCPQL